VHSSDELGSENAHLSVCCTNTMLGSLNKSNFSNLLLICCNSIKQRLNVLVTFFSSLYFIPLKTQAWPPLALFGAQELGIFRATMRVLTGFAVIGFTNTNHIQVNSVNY